MTPAAMPTMEELIQQGKTPFSYYIEKWWWGLSPHQVRLKLLMQPGWRALELDESNPDENRLTIINDQEDMMLFFSFTKDNAKYPHYLISGAYSFRPNYPLVREWEADLSKMPFDSRNSKWLDERSNAKINRIYSNGRVNHLVIMYNKDE
ncbi:MAG TPA: hypothetical protein VK364_04075 [Hymenobacter sp.]|nr:hypothetical protein [Hymenobacter sp.]